MSPELQLIFGCLLLSLAVTYWIRSCYRVWFFQQDLIEIGNRLREKMKAKRKTGDPTYHDLLLILDWLIRNASLMSVPFPSLIRFFEAYREPTADTEPSSSLTFSKILRTFFEKRESMPEEVAAARLEILAHAILHVIASSPLFCLRFLGALFVARSGRVFDSRIAKAVDIFPDSEASRFIKKLLSV